MGNLSFASIHGKPSKISYSSTLTKNLFKTSTTMVKRKSESGYAHLNPLEALTHPLTYLFSQIEKLFENKQHLIQCLHLE